jgi:hypothetical protein
MVSGGRGLDTAPAGEAEIVSHKNDAIVCRDLARTLQRALGLWRT